MEVYEKVTFEDGVPAHSLISADLWLIHIFIFIAVLLNILYEMFQLYI